MRDVRPGGLDRDADVGRWQAQPAAGSLRQADPAGTAADDPRLARRPGALQLAARETPSPLGDELKQATHEHNMGRPISEVIFNISRRIPTSETAQTLAVAVAVAQTGGNLIGVMDRIVENSRARTQYRAKLSALTVQGRWSAWILCSMSFAFAFMAAVLDPNYIPSVVAQPFLVVAFFMLWIPGLPWSVKLARSASASG
jgi:tight adherence protein B